MLSAIHLIMKGPRRSIEDIVRSIDFPHLRLKQGQWLKTGAMPENKPEFSVERMCFYGNKLRSIGMSDTDIILMFSDLYWDAVDEYLMNKKRAG